MSYGIEVNNSQGNKIIQDQQPIYALKRSGTLSQHETTNQGNTPYTTVGLPHLYGYLVSGSNAEMSGDEEVFFEVDVGDWVAYQPWQIFISDGQQNAYNTLRFSQITSTMSSSLSYYVFDKMTSIPNAGASTGYGAQVFNASSQCMWDSSKLTHRVSQGRIISSTTTISSTANAVSLRSWYLQTTSGSGFAEGGHTNFNSWYAKRVSTSSWEIAVGPVDYGFYPYNNGWYNFATTTTVLTGDAHLMLAYV
jgi:hypothetical protein